MANNRTELTFKEQEELWWRAKADKEARDKLIGNYIYVAEREARKYSSFTDLDYEDLFSEACCYVVEAIDKWRPGCCHDYISGMVNNIVAVKMRQYVERNRDKKDHDEIIFGLSEDCIAFDNADDRLILERLFEKTRSTLTSRERMILSMHYGFYDGDPKPINEIARYFKLTPMRITQIRNKALNKCRHPRNWTLKRDRYFYPQFMELVLSSLENIC